MYILIPGDDKHINLAMKILYHLSMDDRVKLMFTQSDCVKLVSNSMQFINECVYVHAATNKLTVYIYEL